MAVVTQPMPVLPTLPPERQLAAVARAVRAVIESEGAAGQLDSSRAVALATLNRAVTEYSRQMRTIGHYPEKVLVAVKSAMRDVGTPIGLKPTVDALVTAAAQWCITAYFDELSMENDALVFTLQTRDARRARRETRRVV